MKIFLLALLQINAEKDEYVDYAESTWLFDTIPLLDKKLLSFKGGHSLPLEYVQKAVDWIFARL